MTTDAGKHCQHHKAPSLNAKEQSYNVHLQTNNSAGCFSPWPILEPLDILQYQGVTEQKKASAGAGADAGRGSSGGTLRAASSGEEGERKSAGSPAEMWLSAWWRSIWELHNRAYGKCRSKLCVEVCESAIPFVDVYHCTLSIWEVVRELQSLLCKRITQCAARTSLVLIAQS